MKSLKAKPKHIFVNINKDSFMCYFLSVCVLAIIAVIISNPTKYNSSIMQGINLFIASVFPGLFPFMFLTKLLTGFGAVKKISNKFSPVCKFLFNAPGISSYVFIMSIVSGYPIGAKLISDLYEAKIIDTQQAKKMVSFCTTSGPIFIIGSVGVTMFLSAKIGLIIYLSHILSSVMCGIILSGKRTKNKQVSKTTTTSLQLSDTLLSSTMASTVESILLVGAYISIFFLLADILTDIGILKGATLALEKLLNIFNINGLSGGIINGILEVTRGCKVLCASNSILSICFTCAVISFSGVCIILQSMQFLSKCKIKARYFIFVKFVHSVLSFFVCLGLCLVINPF